MPCCPNLRQSRCCQSLCTMPSFTQTPDRHWSTYCDPWLRCTWVQLCTWLSVPGGKRARLLLLPVCLHACSMQLRGVPFIWQSIRVGRACVSAGLGCHHSRVMCQHACTAAIRADPSHSWSCNFTDRHVCCSMVHMHTAQGPRGAVFHILVPPYTMPLHEWHSLSPPTAHADKLISMALPCTSHIANCLLVHGAIFPCTASAKTKHAGGLVHQQLCHYHACRGTVMQLVGVTL